MTNSIRAEFIGKPVEILEARNTQLIGLKGKIMDETRNAFKILIDRRGFRELKMVMKREVVFKIGGRTVIGNKIVKRSEDRIKLNDDE